MVDQSASAAAKAQGILMTGTHRLNPTYLRAWRKDYENVCSSYLKGDITLLQAIECFRNLGFKDDALKAEWISIERQKNRANGASSVAAG